MPAKDSSVSVSSAGALSGALLLLIACGSEPLGSAPLGTEIVFQAGDSAGTDIYVVNADGSGLTRLIDNPDNDLAPTWSGDGQRIYFLSHNADGSGISGLYVMNGDGTGSIWFWRASRVPTPSHPMRRGWRSVQPRPCSLRRTSTS